MEEKDKEALIFEQNCEDFRSLNETMWRVPIIVTTLTGGMWFGVGSIDISDDAKTCLLLLAGAANLVFIRVLFRLRAVMDIILGEIKEYQGKSKEKGFVFIKYFSLLLALSAIVSFYAALRGTVFYSGRSVVVEKTSETITEKTIDKFTKTTEKVVTLEKIRKTGSKDK